jgi:hypothetical protein
MEFNAETQRTRRKRREKQSTKVDNRFQRVLPAKATIPGRVGLDFLGFLRGFLCVLCVSALNSYGAV